MELHPTNPDLNFSPEELARIDLAQRVRARREREIDTERDRLGRPLSSQELREISDRVEEEERARVGGGS